MVKLQLNILKIYLEHCLNNKLKTTVNLLEKEKKQLELMALLTM